MNHKKNSQHNLLIFTQVIGLTPFLVYKVIFYCFLSLSQESLGLKLGPALKLCHAITRLKVAFYTNFAPPLPQS